MKLTTNTSFRFICICSVLLWQHASSFAVQHQQFSYLSNPACKLRMTDPEQETSNKSKQKNQVPKEPRSMLDRFTSPVIDDAGLPITDALMAQIVAPSLQVFWIGLVHGPSPTWLRPMVQSELFARGSLLAPTLIHGAGLACCWIAGALAAQAYEKRAIDPTVEGYGSVISTILKAGAFASGTLILGTQLDLLLEFGRYVQPGESEEIDLRLLSATVEVLNDIIFEASTITTMRLSLAFVTAQRSKS